MHGVLKFIIDIKDDHIESATEFLSIRFLINKK